MDATDVLALGLGVTPPWRLVEQRLETDKRPHTLEIQLQAERGALFANATHSPSSVALAV